MVSLEPSLFLAFPVSHELEQTFAKTNPELLAVFTKGGDSYLEERRVGRMRYLGKALGSVASLSTIELAQENIYSLLERIHPEFPYRRQPLILMGLNQTGHRHGE